MSASERAESARQGQPDSGAFKITPRFERRYLENEKSYRFEIAFTKENFPIRMTFELWKYLRYIKNYN